MRRVIAIVFLVGELILTAYLALEAWLLTGWMVSDSSAAGWSASDWYRTGLIRLVAAFAAAVAFGAALYSVNGYAMRDANRRWRPLRPLLAGGLAASVAIGGLVGALEFIATKPLM